MKEETFLKYFRAHVEFFLSKEVITKERILDNLKNGECPFALYEAIRFPKHGLTRYLGKLEDKIVHRYDAEDTFKRNMEEFEFQCKPATIKKMIKIVKATKVEPRKE